MKSNMGGVSLSRMVRAHEAFSLCDVLDEIMDQMDASLILLGDTNIMDSDIAGNIFYAHPILKHMINYDLITICLKSASRIMWMMQIPGIGITSKFSMKKIRGYTWE